MVATYDSTATWNIDYIVTGSCSRSLRGVEISILYNGVEICAQPLDGTLTQGPTTVYATEVRKDNNVQLKTRTFLRVLGWLGVGVLCVFQALAYYWRDTNVIKFSQRKFLHVVLFGASMSYAFVITLGFLPSDTWCV